MLYVSPNTLHHMYTNESHIQMSDVSEAALDHLISSVQALKDVRLSIDLLV